MKKFKISVNGKQYEVDVEEIAANGAVIETKQAVSAPASKPQPANQPVNTASGETGSEKITAPMPGTILKVNVQPGVQVKAGEVLCVLEAMKMENDITAPRDGKVASVNTPKGSSVNAGDVLVSLE